MRLAHLLGPDLKATLASDPDVLREALEDFHPEDIAEIIEDLPLEDAVKLMRILSEETGADVLERLNADRQEEVLSELELDEAISLITEMSADDRVDLVQDLPDDIANELVTLLEEEDPEAAEELRELQAWGEDTAGGLMTPEIVSLPPETTVSQAIDEVRRVSQEREAETIYYMYVVAFGGKLQGVVSLRELILGEPDTSLADIMTEQVVRVAPTDDQEKVAATIAKYDLNAIPVVDENGVMLGVVTIDDVVDVVIEEATEDAQKMGGMVPLEDSYFQTGFGEFIWKRAIWLVVLFFGQLLTATVMERHEEELETILGLVVFIPLIIATGGNSGAQSSTLVIRALALGEMQPADWLRVTVRELGIGIAIGLMLGMVGFARAWFVGGGGSATLGMSVAASIVAVVTLGTMMGSLLPLAIKRIGFDPAVSSTPFIASLVDVLGLVVYFGLAQVIFGMAL